MIKAFLNHLYGKMMLNICLKAPVSYSASFGSYNFSICLWENPHPLISTISRFLNVPLRPQTNIIYIWRPRDTKNQTNKVPTRFRKILFLQISKMTSCSLNMLEKAGTGNSRRSVEQNLKNLGCGIKIFQKTWNRTFARL